MMSHYQPASCHLRPPASSSSCRLTLLSSATPSLPPHLTAPPTCSLAPSSLITPHSSALYCSFPPVPCQITLYLSSLAVQERHLADCDHQRGPGRLPGSPPRPHVGLTPPGLLLHSPAFSLGFAFSAIISNPRLKQTITFSSLQGNVSECFQNKDENKMRAPEKRCVFTGSCFSVCFSGFLGPDEQVGRGGEWRRCLMTVITHLSPTPGRDQ